MIQENVRKKIESLIARSVEIASAPVMQRDEKFVASCQSWEVEALNVIELAVPIENNAYRIKIKKLCEDRGFSISGIRHAGAILQALLSDIDEGLIEDFGNTIRAETLDDLLDQAREYYKRQNKEGSGIIATAVFEDTVRRLARNKKIDEAGVRIDQIISDLDRKQVINGILAKRCRVAAAVRNRALHAQWSEFSLEDVEDVMRLTHQLLTEHLA